MARDLVLKKLEEHDENFVKIDERFVKVDKHFVKVDKKLEEHDEKFDLVIKKLLDHDHEFVKIREEIKESRNEVLTAIDGIAKGIKDLNQEKTFNFATTQRIQEAVDVHDKEIRDIKKVLKMA